MLYLVIILQSRIIGHYEVDELTLEQCVAVAESLDRDYELLDFKCITLENAPEYLQELL